MKGQKKRLSRSQKIGRRRAQVRRNTRRWRLLQRSQKEHGRLNPSERHILAEVSTYAELISAIRGEVQKLGISHLEVDEIAGFQTGYTGKLLMNPGERDPIMRRLRPALAQEIGGGKATGRSLGEMSLPVLLQVLKVKLALVPAED